MVAAATVSAAMARSPHHGPGLEAPTEPTQHMPRRGSLTPRHCKEPRDEKRDGKSNEQPAVAQGTGCRLFTQLSGA